MSDLDKLHDVLKDHQLYHDHVQLDSFITTKAGYAHPYGMYRQALRELHKRERGLKDLGFQRELLEVEIEEMEAGLTALIGFAYRKAAIQIAQKRGQLEDLKKSIADTERELNHFLRQALALKAKIGEISPERRRTLDTEYWVHVLKCQAALDVLTTGHLSRATMENIASLPNTLRMCVLEVVADNNRDRLLRWFEKQDADLPKMLEMK